MSRRPDNLSILLLGGIAVGVIAAVVVMMQLRFSSGDTYGIYSSHRADPLGARAIYEALDSLPGVTCERNYRPISKLAAGPGDVLFIINAPSPGVADFYGCIPKASPIEDWLAAGGRVVLALQPTSGGLYESDLRRERTRRTREQKEEEKTGDKDSSPEKDKGKEPDSKKKESEEKETAKEDTDISHSKFLGCAFELFCHERLFWMGEDEPERLDPAEGSHFPPQALPRWYSNSFLKPAPGHEKDWIPIAGKKDRPMIMLRNADKGSIVVCTDSFFLSNESLWREPQSEFITWLIGDAHRVVFEERLHGVSEDEGIVALALRYRMHGLFLGGIVLFILFVWHNSQSLVPPDERADLGLVGADSVAGQSAASGLVSLLRRGVQPRELLERCLNVWELTGPFAGRVPAKRLEDARAILAEEKSRRFSVRNLPAMYRRLCEALHPPKT